VRDVIRVCYNPFSLFIVSKNIEASNLDYRRNQLTESFSILTKKKNHSFVVGNCDSGLLQVFFFLFWRQTVKVMAIPKFRML
jgi:hypothetical protein